jgi:holliday junction DNA helicase RuvA
VIAFVEGVVDEVGGDRVVVQAGAFGSRCSRRPKALAGCRPGATVRLATHLVVREDAWTLYGFADADGRALFQQLLGVGGVGPKLALGLLTALTPQQVALAVATGDAGPAGDRAGGRQAHGRAAGGGAQGEAARGARGDAAAPRGPSASPAAEDAVAALVALGYRESTVRAAIADLAAQAPTRARGADPQGAVSPAVSLRSSPAVTEGPRPPAVRERPQ